MQRENGGGGGGISLGTYSQGAGGLALRWGEVARLLRVSLPGSCRPLHYPHVSLTPALLASHPSLGTMLSWSAVGTSGADCHCLTASLSLGRLQGPANKPSTFPAVSPSPLESVSLVP